MTKVRTQPRYPNHNGEDEDVDQDRDSWLDPDAAARKSARLPGGAHRGKRESGDIAENSKFIITTSRHGLVPFGKTVRSSAPQGLRGITLVGRAMLDLAALHLKKPR